jgi:hypothetical protein
MFLVRLDIKLLDVIVYFLQDQGDVLLKSDLIRYATEYFFYFLSVVLFLLSYHRILSATPRPSSDDIRPPACVHVCHLFRCSYELRIDEGASL